MIPILKRLQPPTVQGNQADWGSGTWSKQRHWISSHMFEPRPRFSLLVLKSVIPGWAFTSSGSIFSSSPGRNSPATGLWFFWGAMGGSPPRPCSLTGWLSFLVESASEPMIFDLREEPGDVGGESHGWHMCHGKNRGLPIQGDGHKAIHRDSWGSARATDLVIFGAIPLCRIATRCPHSWRSWSNNLAWWCVRGL